MPRIYLDNAATSWPKPESVYLACDEAQRVLGAAWGRGSYREAVQINRAVNETRELLASMIKAPSGRNVSFAFSCTDGLNTALLGLLKPGDHVVTTDIEHNSVLRPLLHLIETRSVKVSYAPCDHQGKVASHDVVTLITPKTRLVAMSHASNVTGAIQDLKPIGDYCHRHEIPFLVDAAQSIGQIPIDVSNIRCGILVAAGHKGLLGPLGTGFVFLTDEMTEAITPLRFGGTGTTSLNESLPNRAPEKFEAGNLNVPGILGMRAGLKFLLSSEGAERIVEYHRLKQKLHSALASVLEIRQFGCEHHEDQLGVFSLQVGDYDSHEVSAILDGNFEIQTRAGLHCAPRIHARIGSDSRGGTLRISLGLFNTDAEIETLLDALQKLVS